MRRLLLAICALAVAAALAVGLAQTISSTSAPRSVRLSPAEIQRRLAGAPAPLAALHRQAGAVLGGGRDAMRARLASLRGHPVVLNKWASWCEPCRAEFPIFQELSVRYGKRVAFLGLDSGDNRQDAHRFLGRFPLSYPSYEDHDERVAFSVGLSAFYPMTAFYDAAGRQQYIHSGGYKQVAKLEQDIRRYALGIAHA